MLAVEVVFGFFILYYVVEEVLEIRSVILFVLKILYGFYFASHTGWEYFETLWNCMDVTVIVVSIATSAIGIYVHQFTQIQLKVSDCHFSIFLIGASVSATVSRTRIFWGFHTFR